MRFSTLALWMSVSASILAAPLQSPQKRALRSLSYNDFQVSDGVAGNALAEVNEEFPVDDPATVSASDLDIISKAAQVAEDAEVSPGGFNDAIAAAGGVKSAAGASLQIGKIKNKVLKLQTDVLRLQIKLAQGDDTVANQLAQQQAKLATNVKLDEGAKGESSTGIDFEA